MRFGREILPFSRQLSFPYLQNGFVLNNERRGKMVPVPLPVIRDKIYAPNRYVKGLLFMRRFHGQRIGDMVRSDLVFLPPPVNLYLFYHYLDVLATELGLWLKQYAPPRKGEVIIDVGAGCGETAWMYYRWFAPRAVISIEPDPERFALLKRNSELNGWPNHTVINDVLRPEHFLTDYGAGACTFAKVDIEGAERGFVGFLRDLGVPFVMETHMDNTRLYVEAGFRKVWDNHRGCALVRSP